MRKLAVAGFVFVALVFFVPTAQAQTCMGAQAITQARPLQAGAGVAFSEDVFAVAGALGGGTDSVFGGVTLARGSIDIGESAKVSSTILGLNAGYQIAVKPDRRSMFCPVVEFTKTFGPNNVLGTGLDVSERTIGGGGAFGVIMGDSAGIQVVPSVAVKLYRATATAKLSGISQSSSDTNGILILGAGILLNSRFSLLPTIRIPFSVEDGQNLYGIAALYSFGK